MLDDARIETLLRDRTRFRRLVHVASCASTQDLAAAENRAGDAIWWADHQTRGRGRQQREWHDDPGQDLAVTTIRPPGALTLTTKQPVLVKPVTLDGLRTIVSAVAG